MRISCQLTILIHVSLTLNTPHKIIIDSSITYTSMIYLENRKELSHVVAIKTSYVKIESLLIPPNKHKLY